MIHKLLDIISCPQLSSDRKLINMKFVQHLYMFQQNLLSSSRSVNRQYKINTAGYTYIVCIATIQPYAVLGINLNKYNFVEFV